MTPTSSMWRYDERRYLDEDGREQFDARIYASTTDSDMPPIAYMSTTVFPIEDIRTWGHKLAASNDLLEALAALVYDIDQSGAEDVTPELVIIARLAIAKARGEQP